MFSLDFLAKVYDYLVIIYYFVCVNMKDLSFQSRILNLLRLLNINLGVNFNDWTTLRKKKTILDCLKVFVSRWLKNIAIELQ